MRSLVWLAVVVACGRDPAKAPAPTPAAPVLGAIPAGPLGDAVRRGQQIVEHTYETLPDHVGARLHCTSCHLHGGTTPFAGPWIGISGMFPEYRSRNARVITLGDRINDCFVRSMNGTALDPGSEDLAAIEAYMSYLSAGQEQGRPFVGRGFKRNPSPPVPDRAHGKEVFQQTCVACHGPEGAGVTASGTYVFPPLWGEGSFNLGAGMARLDTAAAFIQWNMPLGTKLALPDQDAYDVADFVIHQPRPDFANKAADWPRGGKPRDARY